MAQVLVVGATGWIGAQIVEALERRGHTVIAGVRPGKTVDGGRRSVEVDPRDAASLAAAAEGSDAIVSALGRGSSADVRIAADAARPLLTAAARAGVSRLLVVGGAGSLLDDGHRVIDGPDFPEAWKPGSQSQVDALETYLAEGGEVDWAFLSPSDVIEDGPVTGNVELGQDDLLRGPEGESRVTTGDFVDALLDELDTPTRHRERFTVRTV